MTLNTSVYILDPIDVEELFAWGNDNLIKPSSTPRVTRYSIGDLPYSFDSTPITHAHVGNDLGQGFDAIFDIDHWEGALHDAAEEEEDEDMKKYFSNRPKHYAEVSFDTSYGFKESSAHPGISGCDNLHALYVGLLHQHLSEKGVRMAWKNEYSGEIFEGINGIDTLLKDGDDTQEWFHNIAKPTIEAIVASEGGTIGWSN